ncbi:membrane integrity-associated transporter subunit PqiC [Pusillimonas sp.]|uniref:membrane integrity-associated transporter subunit PqiC n=1 Tax=Pusillimonas sp. TaxID=3040095 RepID=UPI0037C732B7
MKPSAILSCLILAAALGGCASAPQSQYYTLSSSEGQAPAPTAQAAFAISLSAVEVPPQVDRPQIVLSHENGTQVTLLNESQWAAPLADEIRNALSRDLSRRLGALDIEPRAAPEDLPLWLLSVTVHRFESVYGHRALLEATWRQAPRHGAQGEAAICRAAIQVPVEQGMPGLVAGHQRVLEELAGLMADKLSGRPLSAATGIALKGCV